jgi:hypothetical protein
VEERFLPKSSEGRRKKGIKIKTAINETENIFKKWC